ncbi:universal stress protein [Flaviaesturariibacter terrae]
MQPIIAATDFSAASQNALRFAARLAIFRNCPLRVIHAYTWPLTSGEPLVLPAAIESIEHGASESLAMMERELKREYPRVDAEFIKRPAADVAIELSRYCNELDPFLMVLGTHERPGADSWFSEGLRIVRKSEVPLLMVPAGFSGTGWMRAVLAFDGAPIGPGQQTRITTLMSELHALLDVVHVRPAQAEQPPFPDLGPVGGEQCTVLAENVTSGLLAYLQQHPTDLMVVLPHHHSLWNRLFSHRHTPSLVSEMPLPVLVMPGE